MVDINSIKILMYGLGEDITSLSKKAKVGKNYIYDMTKMRQKQFQGISTKLLIYFSEQYNVKRQEIYDFINLPQEEIKNKLSELMCR